MGELQARVIKRNSLLPYSSPATGSKIAELFYVISNIKKIEIISLRYILISNKKEVNRFFFFNYGSEVALFLVENVHF